jgi:hypothetical protein
MTNSAGGMREHYFSNAGMLDLEKGTVTPAGGLSEESAREMDLKPNLVAPISFPVPENESATEHAAAVERKLAATEHPSGSGSGNTAVPAVAEYVGSDENTIANMRNWMECVQVRKRPNADIETGYNHSVALCMTIAAMQTGQRVSFDDTRQEVVTGTAAGHMHPQHGGSRLDPPGDRR